MPATAEPTVYITFDDGPHPTATPFVMEQLERYNAHATFFCLGKNVLLYPDIYEQLLEKGHRVANHTHNHPNGYKTDDTTYLENIKIAAQHIDSDLFRPPYGFITRAQIKKLKQVYPNWKIIMWDVLTGDFDIKLSPEKCLELVLRSVEPGSIIVFHDSDKAWDRMSYTLPHLLEYCKQHNWQIKAIP